MIPLIGMLGAVDNEKNASLIYNYVKAIEKSGGLPLLLPFVEGDGAIDEFVFRCDGFLFTGGVDIDPCRYGEEKKPTCGDIQPNRDTLEFKVFKKAFESGKPILGICRGAQLVNVALGGTLYQDLPTEIESDILHRQKEGILDYSHKIKVVKGTPLYALMGEERIKGNSFHHQAIKKLGEGLRVMANADDGVVEAVWYEGDRYLRAYQWHPERLYEADDFNKRIFDDFIAKSKTKR